MTHSRLGHRHLPSKHLLKIYEIGFFGVLVVWTTFTESFTNMHLLQGDFDTVFYHEVGIEFLSKMGFSGSS
jgi:hypothetical protein